jgi:hypothetical protein
MALHGHEGYSYLNDGRAKPTRLTVEEDPSKIGTVFDEEEKSGTG